MKLPNVEEALIAERKITEYLLSETHPEGQEKAEFFARFGFAVVTWEVFAEALRQHAAEHEVSKIVETRFGTRYVVEGALHTPDGRNPKIRSVWFIDKEGETPRLVTAYPLGD